MTSTTIAATLIGALAGPWLRTRILAHAVPYGQPLRSRCPRCRRLASRLMGVPVLPATGRCPVCQRRIGPLPGAVEISLAAALAVLARTAPDPITFAATAWLACYGVVLAYVDITVHRLPDRLVGQAAAGCTTLLTIDAIATAQPTRLIGAGVGMLVCGLIYLVPALIQPDKLLGGDVKLAAATGLALGWISLTAVMASLAFGVLIGVTAALTLRVTGRINGGQAIAHGPAILLGALTAYTLNPIH